MRIILIILVFGIAGCSGNSDMSLPERGFWSERPARTWEESLVTGNGTQGALVMGHPLTDTIILSHAKFYMPLHEPLPPVNSGAKLDSIRMMMAAGEFGKASQYVVDLSHREGWGGKRWTDPFVPAFDIRIKTETDTACKDYRRMVNFETGEATVTWTNSIGKFTRKIFATRADTLVAILIQGPGRGKLNCTISLGDRPRENSWWQGLYDKNKRVTQITAENGILKYRTRFENTWPGLISGLDGEVRVINRHGTITPSNNEMVIQHADEILILCKYSPTTPTTPTTTITTTTTTTTSSYSSLLSRHLPLHRDLFIRTRLDLQGGSDRELSSEALLATSDKIAVNALIEKEFDAARYNILCATGIMPPNLQGIWAGTTAPPWSGDFTQNGNLQVAIASLLSGNMPELMEGFFRYQEEFLPAYRENAQKLYNCRGIHVASRTSSHGLNNHFDRTWPMTFWTTGAAWMAHFFYDYWLYTGDTEFLRNRAFPFMKEAALFYDDFLYAGSNGKWVFNPSYSPENNPGNSPDQACINATMDIAAARELYRNLLTAGKILGTSMDTLDHWKQMLAGMPDYQINTDGALKEYMWDSLSDNYAHRHASHLYGLWEVSDPYIIKNPELMEAAKRAVEERMKVRRMENGGVMAFGMVQLALAAAAVGDSVAVGEMINWLASGYWFNNLVTTHNPREIFNLDLSGGFPAVIIKSLIYSEPGLISVLPACPPAWKSGQLTGALLRGQILLESLEWSPEEIRIRLRSEIKQEVTIRYGKSEVRKSLLPGKLVSLNIPV